MFASGFSWFHALFPELVAHEGLAGALGELFGTEMPEAASVILVHSWLACFIVLGLALLARLGLNKAVARKGIEKFFADDRLTMRNFFEIVAEAWLGIMDDMMPTKADTRVFFPLIGSFFAYIFACNIIGIFPGFLPPTDNVNTNVGMALIIFVGFILIGLYRDWMGFFKHMAGGFTKGPLIFLGLFLFCIEVISFGFRPVSLTLRLTGNMFGDHMVFTIMSDLTYIIVPAIFLGLAVFVSFMQAFIFSLLSSVYIAMALPHPEEHH